MGDTSENKNHLCLTGVFAVLGAVFAFAGPASATPTSSCTVAADGPGCLFYSQAYNGSHTGVPELVSNFPTSGSTAYTFKSAGSGQGQRIGNNNGSNRNADTACSVILWYNTGASSGPSVVLNKYGTGVYQRKGSELGTLLNNLRSQSWSCA